MIATPVLLLALLGFLIWGAAWGWRNLTAPLPSPSPTPCVTKKAAVITPELVSVRVLNGGFTSGLAGKVGKHLENHGYTILQVGNTEERVKGTIIRGSADDGPMLQLVQSEFRNSTIEHDDRVDGSIDVLVGTAYEGVNKQFLKEVKSEGGVVCEFVSPSPSPSPSGSAAAPSPSPTS